MIASLRRLRSLAPLSLWGLLAVVACSAELDGPKSADADATDGTDTHVDVPTDPDTDAGDDTPPDVVVERSPAPESDGIYGFAHGCYAVEGFDGTAEDRFLAPSDDGATYGFVDDGAAVAARFRMQPADLGTYLLYDAERHYLTAEPLGDDPDAVEGWQFTRAATLQSDIGLLDDTFRSPAEWVVEVSPADAERYRLQHLRTGLYLAVDGLVADGAAAAVVSFFPRDGCAEFPEMTLDAVGEVVPRQWSDGSVWGLAEIHSHVMTNFGFGGGGIFHGAPFHRLGVEHALGSCEPYHGMEGRRDLVGFFYDGNVALDYRALLPIIVRGELDDFNHHTDGYPDFTDWPNAWRSSTHQTMYYRWIERAYLGGMRLLVQHATGNSVLCDFVTGVGSAQTRYACNDMVSVDRSITEVRNLERYIDAQAGGPGLGWFRVVESPQQAREVIDEGKLAVVLGIEISNLFDCFLTPPDGFERCDVADVRARLDRYHDLGVRVLFPVHKFDNAFASGDGAGGVIELANIINSGHYSNLVEDCPLGGGGFDSGSVTFSGLNRPREEYDAPAPLDMSEFPTNPLRALLPIADRLSDGPVEGNFCLKAGMTDLGETLLREMMLRGMLPDIAHLGQRSRIRALEILGEADYPATSTHGNPYGPDIYPLGGMSSTGFHRCVDPEVPGMMGAAMRARFAERASYGIDAGEGFAFDFNGFAGARRPRFGPDSGCGEPQANPVTWPFPSYDGEIEFQQPRLGNRTVDYNTEGMIHFGLLPELIQEARLDGMTDEELEPLFRSAEAYLRMWERAELRAAELRAAE